MCPYWVVLLILLDYKVLSLELTLQSAFGLCKWTMGEKEASSELNPRGPNQLTSHVWLYKPNPHLKAPQYLPPIAVTQTKGNISPSCVYQTEFGEVTFTFNSFSNSYPWHAISTNTLDPR